MRYLIGLGLMATAAMLSACAPGTWTDSGKEIKTDVSIVVENNQEEVRVFLTPDFLVEVGPVDQTSEGQSSMSVNPTLSVPVK